MIKVLVFNPDTNDMEEYFLNLNDPMPYAPNMSVREFRGKSNSNMLWSDKRLLEAYQMLRNTYGKPIQIGYAFRRILEGNYIKDSNYYAGLALDVAQKQDMESRDLIRELARNLNIFNYVLPKVFAPNLVHLEQLITEPSCPGSRYPVLRKGDKGVYVLVLQDILTAFGFYKGKLDGIFGDLTADAVLEYQKKNNLKQDKVVGCKTWMNMFENLSNNP